MFRLYEPGHRASRAFGYLAYRFFAKTPQTPRVPYGIVFVIYDAS